MKRKYMFRFYPFASRGQPYSAHKGSSLEVLKIFSNGLTVIFPLALPTRGTVWVRLTRDLGGTRERKIQRRYSYGVLALSSRKPDRRSGRGRAPARRRRAQNRKPARRAQGVECVRNRNFFGAAAQEFAAGIRDSHF